MAILEIARPAHYGVKSVAMGSCRIGRATWDPTVGMNSLPVCAVDQTPGTQAPSWAQVETYPIPEGHPVTRRPIRITVLVATLAAAGIALGLGLTAGSNSTAMRPLHATQLAPPRSKGSATAESPSPPTIAPPPTTTTVPPPAPPPPPPVVTSPPASNGIPQSNGGDQDPDNNGGPDDHDGET